MTTATEPPLVDEPSIGVDELPALDQPDERACQFWPADPCPRTATWVVTIAKDCEHVTQRALSCEPCLYFIRQGGVYCTYDNKDARISQVEPLR